MRIVAFGHRSRVGKDTAARFLVEFLSRSGRVAERRSFAAPLKDAAHRIWWHYGLLPGDWYESGRGLAERTVPLPGIGKDPVQLWIELGMKVREIHAATWLDGAFAPRPGAPAPEFVVLSDLRFPNEADAVEARGGVTVRVESSLSTVWRDSDYPLRDRAFSETIVNDGSLEDLRRKVEDLARRRVL